VSHRIGMAVVCLHISAVLYLLVGILPLLFFFLSEDTSGAEATLGIALSIGLLVLCLALIAGVEFVASGLRRRKFWAWIAGLCIFAIYLPTLFLPLGAIGLWGLLDTGSRREFGVGSSGPG